MNRIARCIAIVTFLTAGSGTFAAPPKLTLQQCNDYPFVRPQGSVTHRQLINELEELEALGYDPSAGDDTEYPNDINTAQRQLWRQHAEDCPQQSSIATAPAR